MPEAKEIEQLFRDIVKFKLTFRKFVGTPPQRAWNIIIIRNIVDLSLWDAGQLNVDGVMINKYVYNDSELLHL